MLASVRSTATSLPSASVSSRVAVGMLRHRQQLRLLPLTTSSPSSRAVLEMAPANRRPASSSSSPSSSSSSSSLPSGSSQHANRSFEQTISAASPPLPPSTSFLRRIWNTSFADPANNMLTAMSLLWRNTMYSTELWVAYRQEGHTVTRRADIKHMQRNKRDLLRAMPAAIFFAIPFAIPLLPVLMRVAPGFLPSVFVTREVLEMKVGVMRERREKGAEAVLEAVDKAIGRSVGGGSSGAADSRERQHAAALARRWTLLREQQLQQRPGVAPGAVVKETAAPSDSDLISLQTLFRDHATLLDVPPATLRTMMSFAGISTPLSPVLSHVFARLPRARLLVWIDWVLKDDGLLRQQGINSLSDYELMEALDERGFINLTNRSTAELRTALAQHLRFTKAATDAIIPRARAAAAADARNAAGITRAPIATTATSANAALPHDEIAAVATLVLVARAMRLHEV
ncbi:hypothetical protein BDZ88DRAFT_449432 [Geranomyces variabilis]|nr:hypothetical protein BDZ88DRAFT_449432 [Geranomyces variabilis]KAJ3142081.1 hypothetical protein HDU90_004354 [Geranomyces variabilis]